MNVPLSSMTLLVYQRHIRVHLVLSAVKCSSQVFAWFDYFSTVAKVMADKAVKKSPVFVFLLRILRLFVAKICPIHLCIICGWGAIPH